MARNRISWRLAAPAGLIASVLVASGCAGAGGGSGAPVAGGSGKGGSLNVLMVGNPQMEDIQKLTADGFTKDTGIKVNYTVLPENELRDKVTQDIATQAEADDRLVDRRGREAVRRPVLRRVLDADVPQGRPGCQGHHDA